MKILIITPTRNEEEYLTTTIECMLRQTLLPDKWIIVNDGSTDRTEKIIKKHIHAYSFIDLINIQDRGYRLPGKGVVEAFYIGLNSIDHNQYDIISKFDADLYFNSNLLLDIKNAFISNTKLGITGPVRYERSFLSVNYKKVILPQNFVGGPAKFYLRPCFEDIKGLVCRAGWDGVDTIKAQMCGWETRELDHSKIIHLKPTGTAKGEGFKKACYKYGDVSYYMGGYFWYFLFRIFFRSLIRLNFRHGLFMIKGYHRSKSKNITRESNEFRNYLKKVQLNNTLAYLKRFFSFITK